MEPLFGMQLLYSIHVNPCAVDGRLTQFMQDPALYLKNPGTSGLGRWKEVVFSRL